MEVRLNPDRTTKPQPISAAKPHQYLHPSEQGSYPSVHDVNKAKALAQIQAMEQAKAKASEQVKGVDDAQQIQRIQHMQQTPQVEQIKQTEQLQSVEDIKETSFLQILVQKMKPVSMKDSVEQTKIQNISLYTLNDARYNYNLLARLINHNDKDS